MTMKSSVAYRMRRSLPCLFFVMAAVSTGTTVTPAYAADGEFRPLFSISEEVNDNVFETARNKRRDFITRVQPGFTSRYQAPLWNWDAAYTFDYRTYARNSRNDEFTHNASLRGTVSLIDNFMFLDVADTYQRVTLDVTRTAATESSLFLNQTDQNNATVSPYVLWRLGEKGTLKTGYRYGDIRYWGNGIDRYEHGAFAELNRELFARFSVTAAYGFTRLESVPTRYDKHDVSAGFRYEYADRSFVFGQAGNSWQQFRNSSTNSFFFWNAGITHDLGGAVINLETRVQTSVDPLALTTRETVYSGRIEKTLDRGTVSFASLYTEYTDALDSGTNRHRLSLTGGGRYEILPDLNASLSVTADRFSRRVPDDYPYHLIGSAGLSWAFNRDLSLGLSYSYAVQRKDMETARDEIGISRVILEVRKTF